MNLQEIIDVNVRAFEQCKKLYDTNVATRFNPTLEYQLETIRFLEELRDREKEIVTTVFLNSYMREEDMERLEKRLTERFGNKVVCLPVTVGNVAYFNPESFIAEKFDIRKGEKK